MLAKWIASVSVAVLAAVAAPVIAQEAPTQVAAAAVPQFTPRADQAAEQRSEFRTLDEDVQDLKKQALDLNRDLFLLEEELLFPSNTQTAVFVSMDVGEFFGLDSVELKIDNKDVANYLYTERESEALLKGGVQRLFIGNLKAGEHELVAVFTGQGPHTRDYRRAASLMFEKGIGPKYIELTISDRETKQQPEFIVKEWE
ncbi:MAG TPA: AraC family transcriptional regulator [Gammaproteobacteria bacterium]